MRSRKMIIQYQCIKNESNNLIKYHRLISLGNKKGYISDIVALKMDVFRKAFA